MSAHISCHSNDILPNSFPPPRPTQKDHGSMSQYEQYHVMHKTVPFMAVGVEGGTGFVGEDDTFPVIHKPAPTITDLKDFRLFQDPDLCVTPEKHTKKFNPNKYRTKSSKKETQELDDTPRSQKVRFDSNVAIKHLSPEYVSDCSIIEVDRTDDVQQELSFSNIQPPTSDEDANGPGDVDETNVKTYQYTVEAHVDEDGYGLKDVGQNGHLADELHGASQDFPMKQTSGQVEEVVLPVQPGPKLPRKVYSKGRETVLSKHLKKQSRQSVDPDEEYHGLPCLLDSEEHVLARPEFHSTLWMSQEIKQVQNQELDVATALQKKLKVSDKTRNQIAEKAYSKLNARDDRLYPGLVSVDVREDDLVLLAEKQLAAKAKPVIKSKTSKPEDQIEPPDIMEFFTPDLQRESANYSLHSQPEQKSGLQTADLHRAFDVYRRVRAWEGW